MIGKKVIMELRKKTTVSDGFGGFVTTVEGLRRIMGVLSVIKGDERLSADKLTVISSHYFYVDFPIGLTITAEHIFQYGTREFKIIYISDLGANQNKRLRITLKEGV